MRTLAITAAALLIPGTALAQNPATVTPFQLTGTYTQNFDSLAGSGATGTALPPGFQVIESGQNADNSYTVGNGSSNAGTSYSFGATGSTERALGSLGSGNLTSILFGGVFTNALGGTIASLAFSYVGEQWRLGNSTDDGLTFQYRVGATDVSGTTGWTTVAGLGFTPLFTNGTTTGSALDGNAAADQRAISATIGGLSLLNGQSFGFRWVDVDSTGSDQGLAVDNLAITGTLAQAAVPEAASWAMMIAGFGVAGIALRRRPARRATA